MRAVEFGHLIKAEVSSTEGNEANLLGSLPSFWSDGKDGNDFGESKLKGQQTFSVKHHIINISGVVHQSLLQLCNSAVKSVLVQ